MSSPDREPAGSPPPAPATPAAPAPASVELLWDDAHSRIEWHRPPGSAGRPVVVTFDPLLYLWPKPAFGLDFLLRQQAQVVTVRRKTEHFYQPLDRATFLQALAPVLAAGPRLLAYGSSLGAYAALYYLREVDAEVIALSPRVSVHPTLGTAGWQAKVDFRHEPLDPAGTPARCRACIAYDPRDAIDRRFVDEALRPAFPQARFQRLPFTGHPVTAFLSEAQHLSAWIRAWLDDRPPPPLDRRAGRRRSATWHQVVAERCARRGRLRLAEALVDRSLALRERNLLAHRTRGLVKSLQGDWPQAAAALERALALDPADPLTQSLLQRAQRALAGGSKPVPAPVKAAELLPPPAPPARWWRRATSRLRRLLSGG